VPLDDRIRILSAVKTIWGDAVPTVFVRQGKSSSDLLAA
jgi:hypothetical protein